MADTIRDILNEIRDSVQVIRDKSVKHDYQLKYLLGNGQPGKLKEIETILEDLKKTKWQIMGMASLLAFLMEILHITGAKLIQVFK
jgi:hypothetical protein